MKRIPPRNKKDPKPSDIRKVGSTVLRRGLEALPAFGPILLDLIDAHTERLRESVKRDEKERLRKFYEDLLAGDTPLDSDVADKMLDSRDYHALLRACLADVEAEKVHAYAQLAKAVATGRVAAEWVRHYILSLRDISAKELDRLQRAYVAKHYPLIPTRGPIVEESVFLKSGAPGSMDSIVMGNLESRGFIHEGRLSEAGIGFIKACMSDRDLSPAAIGYNVWSEQVIAILNYEIGDKQMDHLAVGLAKELRALRMRSSIFAVNRTNVDKTRMHHTHAVLLTGSPCKHLLDNVEHLARFAQEIPLIAVSVRGPIPLPAIRPTRHVIAANRSERDVVNDVREAIMVTIRGAATG